MKISMRFALLAGLLLFAACGDDDHDKEHTHEDAGAGKGGSGGTRADAGVPDGSKLDRPGSLPRPPKAGLPAELRPPR
jgi:hypothetical protein